MKLVPAICSPDQRASRQISTTLDESLLLNSAAQKLTGGTSREHDSVDAMRSAETADHSEARERVTGPGGWG